MSKKILKPSPAPGKILPVRFLVLDVDGVLTDGSLLYTEEGTEVKRFDVKDGAGLKYWMRSGYRAGIVTGRSSPVVERRAKELGVEFVAMGAKDKLPVFDAMLRDAGVRPEESAVIGDDLPDLPLVRRAGLGAAVADAVEDVREAADVVTRKKGGRGAVRELIEFILKRQGKWDAIMARYLAALLLPLLLLSAAKAGEADAAQPYEKIRYPTFADGRLQSLLEADQAEAYDLTLGTPRINLKNVVITLYDHSDQAKAITPADQPLPVKMTITSDRGYFTRRPPEPGATPEEIANLEGNVVLRQMRSVRGGEADRRAALRPSRLPPGVETEIHCEHAQWNNTLRKLNGDGEVEFLQEDSRIVGTGFLYLADDEALGVSTSTSAIRDWGGIVYIEHNARMEIDRGAASGASGRTEITCRDTASYKLREREIQFERDVTIRRPGLVIESDILKVFLRREDEVAPEPGENEVLPGQVRSIVATIGNRPGSVAITGYTIDAVRGTEVMQFLAKGGRADFDYDANRITLTDVRENRYPEVEFGADRDRITDGRIVFVFRQDRTPPDPVPATRPPGSASAQESRETILETLTTTGGHGEVILRTRRQEVIEGANVPAGAAAIPTVVSYRGEMNYNRTDGRIRFLERVALRRADLVINAESLDIRLVSDGVTPVPSQLNRILADRDVVIRTGEYEAKAQRAEYDIYQGEIGPPGSGLDTLRLYGPPQGTPPHPWISDAYGNQITAPEIHMQRLTVGPGQRDMHLMVARGSSSCDFVTAPAGTGSRAKIVNIKCERGMEYNQANRKASFIGQVIVTSDAPEDSYVLTSDRLLIDFEETPKPADPADYDIWIRRITAEGNARLMQDTRICEAINIIRDFPTSDPNEGDIYLQGALPSPGQPPMMAVYREQTGTQIGAMFAAPLIKSSARGNLIQANGPGQLSMPDEEGTGRSEIHFEGASSYEAVQDGAVSDARFWGGVRLVHPAESVMVNAEEMDARFIREESSATFGGAATNVEIERIGRLRRVEGRNNVRLVHALPRGGQRVAVGDIGVVEFTTTGNILRLTANREADARRFVIARDHDGMTLRSPEIEIREAQGVTRASGPGDLQIPANRAADGMPTPTRVLYGAAGSLVYNELGLNIRVSDSVRIVQPGPGENWSAPGLDGICDRMEISLFEPPAAGMEGEDALSRVQRMDALGNVVLRVYADPPAENPGVDWLSRPGTTFFTRGEHAVYDVPMGRISIASASPRRPQLLLNIVEGNDPPRRQRLRADRFVLQNNTTPRRWNYEGELNADTIPDGEPFDFTPDAY